VAITSVRNVIRRPRVLLAASIAGVALGVAVFAVPSGGVGASVPPVPPVDAATTLPEATQPGTPTTVPATGASDGTEADDEGGLAPTVPLPSLPAIENPAAESAPLIPIPAGCPTPPTEQVVFIGTLVARDSATGRFVVGRVRSGDTAGYAVDGLIDVRYGDDVRFLHEGSSYLIGAAVDRGAGVLASTVRPPAPRFGGNEVASVGATDLVCPAIADPVRTLELDGTSVESGVLTSLADAKGRVLRAILQPVGVALLVLIGLTTLKLLVFAAMRSARNIGERRPKDALSRR